MIGWRCRPLNVTVQIERTPAERRALTAVRRQMQALAPQTPIDAAAPEYLAAARHYLLLVLVGWQRSASHRHHTRQRHRRWRSRLQEELRRRQAPPPVVEEWTPWIPGPQDRPGDYQPTIVCRHGDAAGRGIVSTWTVTTDTAEHRTPTWWARALPGVAFELLLYPHGFYGKPTRRRRTREHRSLGRFDLGAHLPDLPLGMPRPVPSVIVITTPAGTMLASTTGREDSRGRAIYAVAPADWQRVLASVSADTNAGGRERAEQRLRERRGA